MMKQVTGQFTEQFYRRNPQLTPIQTDISRAAEELLRTFSTGGKVLLCGNGGSCADCDHIAGELLKGFLLKRPLPQPLQETFGQLYGAQGKVMADKLQVGLPAISLNAHVAAASAFANDVDAEYVYAQQVQAFGRAGDVLIAISTSGNAANVVAAVMTAKTCGMSVIALTGTGGGRLAPLADVAIRAPETETYLVQEQHLKIYHLLCAVTELELFDR